MKELKENLIHRVSLILIILLFVFIEYYLHSKDFYSISADDSSHTLQAYDWYKNQSPFFASWLPFQRIINGTALIFYYDLIITPRVTSFLFGLLTLIFLIIISNLLFKNRIVSLLSGLLGAISVPIVIFSAVPLIEIYFFFFVLSSLTFYFLWREKGKSVYIWLSVISATAGNMTRYEAWLFSFFLFIIITYDLVRSQKNGANKNSLLIIAVILSVFPLYWIYLSSISIGNVNGFVSSVTSRYTPGILQSEIKNNVLYNFFSFNISSMGIIGIISLLALNMENVRVKIFNIVFFGTLICFSVLSFIIKAMPTHNHWRIAMIWSLLLLPFTAYWLYYLLNSSMESKIHKVGFGVFLLLIIYFSTAQINRYSSTSYLTSEDIKVGKYLRQIINDDKKSKIFIGRGASDKWKHINILVASQEPDYFLISLEKVEYITSDTLQLDQKIISELKAKNVKFILMPSNIRLHSELNITQELNRFHKWVLYKLLDW